MGKYHIRTSAPANHTIAQATYKRAAGFLEFRNSDNRNTLRHSRQVSQIVGLCRALGKSDIRSTCQLDLISLNSTQQLCEAFRSQIIGMYVCQSGLLVSTQPTVPRLQVLRSTSINICHFGHHQPCWLRKH